MAYKVIVTENAAQQVENILDYIIYRLHIGSNVYKKATDLIKGDIVSFSGRFVKRYGEESYFNKYSYDNTSPELLFKFDDIELERSAPKRIL